MRRYGWGAVALVLAALMVAHADAYAEVGLDVAAVQRALAESGANWTAGETSVSDLSPEEMRLLCGGLLSPGETSEPQPPLPSARQVPSAFDWRDEDGDNWVTDVQYQGGCSSCWAFATCGVLEVQMRIALDRPRTPIDLSEQYMVSCSGAGCGNWTLGGALAFLVDVGTPDEDCFPYVASVADCDDACDDCARRYSRVLSWGWVGGSSGVQTEEDIKDAVLGGPVATWMDVYQDFYAYESGVYEHVTGNEVGGHFVIIVGWDDDDDCWICKNSWGDGWGEDGFFRIAMGQNEVGIEQNTAWLRPQLVYLLDPTTVNPASVGDMASPINFTADVRVGPHGGLYGGLASSDFVARVDDKSAPVANSVQRRHVYELNVVPPDEGDGITAAGRYDLDVEVGTTVVSEEQTESEAVLYTEGTGIAVDVITLIDRSSSMGTYGYIDDALDAASEFVELMNLGDMIGVVSFNGYASVNYALTTIASETIKDQAQSAIESLYASGMTSIGAGLRTAQQQLDSYGNPDDPWSIILLSDGYNTQSPGPSDVINEIPDKTDVHTIALGYASDEAVLNYIAVYTGGTYHFVPSSDQLHEIYDLIRGQVTQSQVVVQGSGTVDSGQTGEVAVPIDDTMEDVIFRVNWGSGDIDLTLLRPGGTVLDSLAAAADTTIVYEEGLTSEYYRIRDPEPGQWEMLVYYDAASGQQAYNATVSGQSPLKIRSSFYGEEYTTGQAVCVLVTLAEGGSPVTGASVTATATTPVLDRSLWVEMDGDFAPPMDRPSERETYEFTLYDDGGHADGMSGDGVYGNYFGETTSSGSYVFEFEATGVTNAGASFSRKAQQSIVIGSQSAGGDVSGEITYEGLVEGDVWVRAWTNDPYMGGSPDYVCCGADSICPMDYILDQLPEETYYIDAFIDIDADGGWDPGSEPRGVFGAPDGVDVTAYIVTDEIDILLEDPPPLDELVAYPNPYRGEAGRTTEIAFGGMMPGTDVEVYTVSGKLVASGELGFDRVWRWDVRNESGEPVGRGVYLFVAKEPGGRTSTGRFAIIGH